MSNTVVGGGHAAACSSSSARSMRVPSRSQCRIDSLSSHRPMTLRRNRIRPSAPTSLVKLADLAASVTTGWVSSTPTSPQVPQEM